MNYKYILTAILVMSVFSGTASAWVSGYDHRMAITVNNAGASSLSYYQFNFTNDTNVLVAAGNMQASGADCRITDASDNLLPFWNETPFNAAGTRIWVNATTLAVGDNTFYMYYGNTGASSVANISNMAYTGDDFNYDISGPYKTFVDGGLQEVTSRDWDARGIYYNGRTYVGYSLSGQLGHGMVTYYDHSTDTWATPVDVGVAGDYCMPIMAICADGRIVVCYGGKRGIDLKRRISTNPEDITSWGSEYSIAYEPQRSMPIITSNGSIYVFYSGADNYLNATSYRMSTDGGNTFGSEVKVISREDNSEGSFTGTIYGDVNDNIHMMWSDTHGGGYIRHNVYYLRFNTSQSKWEKMDGTEVSLPITNSTQADLVLDTDNTLYSNTFDLLMYDNSPIILSAYNTSYQLSKWSGTAWNNYTIASDGRNCVWDSGRLLINGTDIYAYVHRGDPPCTGSCGADEATGRGGHVNVYKSTDGGETWTFIQDLNADDDSTVRNTGVTKILNWKPEVKMLWKRGTVGGSSYGLVYHGSKTIASNDSASFWERWNGSISSISNGILTLRDGDRLDSKKTYGIGYACRGKFKPTSIVGNGASVIGFNYFDPDVNAVGIDYYQSNLGLSTRSKKDGVYTQVKHGDSTAAFHTHDIIRESTTSNKYRVDDGSVWEINTNISTAALPLTLATRPQDSTTAECDWFFARKYASPEPAATLGAEETGGGGCGAYNITLPLGWSIIGWTNPTASTAHSMGGLIGGSCQYVTERNSTTGLYVTHVMSIPAEDNFAIERGWGYFVRTTAETLWGRDS